MRQKICKKCKTTQEISNFLIFPCKARSEACNGCRQKRRNFLNEISKQKESENNKLNAQREERRKEREINDYMAGFGLQQCNKCQIIKTFDCYQKTATNLYGYFYTCKSCRRIIDYPKNRKRMKEFRENNYEYCLEKERQSRNKNREKLNEYNRKQYRKNLERERLRAFRYWSKPENKRKRADKVRIERQTNPAAKIENGLRRTLNGWLKRRQFSKIEGAIKMLGCTLDEFVTHIESLWSPGMNWQNYGRGYGKWQIDHIIPCSVFDFTIPEHQKKCFYYKNMQPLWADDNMKKSNKILYPFNFDDLPMAS